MSRRRTERTAYAQAMGLVLAMLCQPQPGAAADTESRTGSQRRLGLGGEASASIAGKDEGRFNTYEYGHNALRVVRLRIATELTISAGAAVLGEARYESGDHPHVYSLYLRLRPHAGTPLDLQVGQIPPVFGAYPRRAYAADNPLIGQPLAYQYLTSLRADAAPATVQDLLSMRGRGWGAYYPLGRHVWTSGLSAVNTQRWDTGLQLRFASDTVEAAAAVTQGSPSNPRFRDDNDGKSLSGRLAWWPAPSVLAGISAGTGRYLGRTLERDLGRQWQRVVGADLEFSRGRWLARAEGVWSAWDSPLRSAPEPLEARAISIESRVKIVPGWSVAARADRLSFGRIVTGTGDTPWDYSVTRLEGGVAFTPLRHMTVKTTVQHNRRDGSAQRQTLVAGQVLLWF